LVSSAKNSDRARSNDCDRRQGNGCLGYHEKLGSCGERKRVGGRKCCRIRECQEQIVDKPGRPVRPFRVLKGRLLLREQEIDLWVFDLPLPAGPPRSKAQYQSAKMTTFVTQMLTASNRSVRPGAAWPPRIASSRCPSAPKFMRVTIAVSATASTRTPLRAFPTCSQCSDFVAPLALLCVHAVPIDSRINSANSNEGAIHLGPRVRSFTRPSCNRMTTMMASRASQKS
jgi:hypothetical protein